MFPGFFYFYSLESISIFLQSLGQPSETKPIFGDFDIICRDTSKDCGSSHLMRKNLRQPNQNDVIIIKYIQSSLANLGCPVSFWRADYGKVITTGHFFASTQKNRHQIC